MERPDAPDEPARARAVGRAEPVALVEGPRVTAFRGWPLVVVIALSVAAGVGLNESWGMLRAALTPAPQAVVSKRGIDVGPLVLAGPAGSVTLPADEPVLVHVWLQGCADCMDAFRTHKRLLDDGALPAGVRVVNVAYGKADATFADAYGVSANLVFDDGAALVRPLGISTFTTLLLDPAGRIRLRLRPTDAGYALQLRGALAALASER